MLAKIVSVNSLLGDEVVRVNFADIVDLNNVGMIKFCSRTSFTAETRQIIFIAGKVTAENLDGNLATQLNVARRVNIGHSSTSKLTQQLVIPQPNTDQAG